MTANRSNQILLDDAMESLKKEFGPLLGRAYDLAHGESCDVSHVQIDRKSIFENLEHCWSVQSNNTLNCITSSGSTFESFASNFKTKNQISYDGVFFQGSIKTNYSKETTESTTSYFAYMNAYWEKALVSLESGFRDYLTDEFNKDIEALDPTKLLDKYGAYLLTSFTVGGKTEFFISTEQANFDSMSEFNIDIHAAYKGFSGHSSTTNSNAIKKINQSSDVKCVTHGGDSSLQPTELAIESPEKLNSWIESLDKNPSMVQIAPGGLMPIWDFAATSQRKLEIKNAFLKQQYQSIGIQGQFLKEVYFISHTAAGTSHREDVEFILTNGSDPSWGEGIPYDKQMINRIGEDSPFATNNSYIIRVVSQGQQNAFGYGSMSAELSLKNNSPDTWQPDTMVALGLDIDGNWSCLGYMIDNPTVLRKPKNGAGNSVNISETLRSAQIDPQGSEAISGIHITVGTESNETAGTDSRIYLELSCLIDGKVESAYIFLDHPNNDDFRRNRVDAFYIPAEDMKVSSNPKSESINFDFKIEQIQKCQLYASSSGNVWKCASILMTAIQDNGLAYPLYVNFAVDTWVGLDRGYAFEPKNR
ncbi:MAC/perforin domain-containing protein [Reinekea sp. G2M2-21]|uniref:MAC/perforin domain-containing protein n=1 Tax=Reinekea sp. G2M2-21 TaxID=2788942 RepID=UPI0018A9220F|nr:MAC/perforin domain-containing protein [Reinekea sp. G2M2-21]